ncbi:diaminopimelate decarboxylase [Microbulbifer echini]|uniref:Diaminopimelate decarboxylase n=1 Tax=Microbulbifer echini TaxID=1529067 RepID=A0ABV4NN47_9GAMM
MNSIPQPTTNLMLAHPWWQREDLKYINRRLYLAGQSLEQIAKQVGTPTFVYSTQRIRENIKRLRVALSQTGLEFDIYYAMKANRNPSILTHLAANGDIGIDACSPKEVLRAMSCGFSAEKISFTGTSVSMDDWNFLYRQQGIKINLDSLAALKNYGAYGKGKKVGIRINPALGLGYNDNTLLRYSGTEVTKFGIYQEQLDEAMAIARFYDLKISRVHFHTGCGYLNQQLPVWDEILAASLEFIDRLGNINEVNLGGGLGVPHTSNDAPLDLSNWKKIIHRHFKGKNIRIAIEPGDYLLKDAGVLLLQTVYLEPRRDKFFLGVNGGFNLAIEPGFYQMPCEPTPCVIKGNKKIKVTIAGNINESVDIWAKDIDIPEMNTGDTLVLINAGAYASAMSSNHCMRGEFNEIVIP